MSATPVQRFWTLLSLLGQKDNMVKILAPHGVISIKNLSPQKQEEVITNLESEWKSRSKRPRGTVIHYLCIMPGYNYKTIADEPNYELIDEWTSKIMGKPLNKLSLAELNKASTIVKAWYNKQIKASDGKQKITTERTGA